MSGSSCMMGLYPQNSSIITPIPVHTVTQNEDKVRSEIVNNIS